MPSVNAQRPPDDENINAFSQALSLPLTETQNKNLNAVRFSLGTKNPPALLTEKQVEQIGLRTATSLRRDRCVGRDYLPFIKLPGGAIRYRLIDVLNAMGGTSHD